MRSQQLITGAVVALIAMAAAGACSDAAVGPLEPEGPNLHVGYKGPDVPLGFVENNAECHIGKKGNRWPSSEQYEVKVYDSKLVTTPSGVMILVCQGDIPEEIPVPESAELYEGVLCFMPNQISTRKAREVFTPGGRIILTCQYNPHRD